MEGFPEDNWAGDRHFERKASRTDEPHFWNAARCKNCHLCSWESTPVALGADVVAESFIGTEVFDVTGDVVGGHALPCL